MDGLTDGLTWVGARDACATKKTFFYWKSFEYLYHFLYEYLFASYSSSQNLTTLCAEQSFETPGCSFGMPFRQQTHGLQNKQTNTTQQMPQNAEKPMQQTHKQGNAKTNN